MAAKRNFTSQVITKVLFSQMRVPTTLKCALTVVRKNHLASTFNKLQSLNHAFSGTSLETSANKYKRCLSSLASGTSQRLPFSSSSSPHHSESHSFHTSSKCHEALSENIPRPAVQIESSSLSLHVNRRTFDIPLLWLRDHCRCPSCYNYSTFQKNVSRDLMELNLDPVSVRLDGDTDSLVINWQDGHTSTYPIKEIETHFYPGRYRQHSTPRLWDGASLEAQGIPSVPFKEHMNSEAGLRQTIKNLVTFGVTFVDESPVSLEGTQQVSERVGKVMPTLFGDMWALSSGTGDFKDTAYTNIPLGAHTDLTYYACSAGIQVFHCAKHRGAGGQTLLVDGFHAASVLRDKFPESFACLSSCAVPHENIEPLSDQSPGYHFYHLSPVLTVHPNSGDLIQIRYNPYDRAPLNTLPPDQIQDFYTAYHRLSQIIEDPASEFWIPLTPGRVILIDNWRVMHGRAAFTGERTLFGCYLQRDEWVARARNFNLF